MNKKLSPARIKACDKYRASHEEKLRAYAREYYQANKESICEKRISKNKRKQIATKLGLEES